jgi:glutamine amidotransferase
MNKKKITIVDYKCGNIFSLKRIVKKLDCTFEFTSDPEKIIKADKLILPGVGAFKVGIENLKKNNLDKAINEYIKKGNYIMGICLGMQLLMDKSEEFGVSYGLGLIKGEVKKLECKKEFSIPNIGWSNIDINNDFKKNDFFLLDNIKNKSFFYFIHTYKVITNHENVIAKTNYGGDFFASIVSRDNILGVQFHPEKSGKIGEKMIGNFINV